MFFCFFRFSVLHFLLWSFSFYCSFSGDLIFRRNVVGGGYFFSFRSHFIVLNVIFIVFTLFFLYLKCNFSCVGRSTDSCSPLWPLPFRKEETWLLRQNYVERRFYFSERICSRVSVSFYFLCNSIKSWNVLLQRIYEDLLITLVVLQRKRLQLLGTVIQAVSPLSRQ